MFPASHIRGTVALVPIGSFIHHPSLHIACRAGACPTVTGREARCCSSQGRNIDATSHVRTANLETTVNLTYMSLDRRKKLKNPEGAHTQTLGEHVNWWHQNELTLCLAHYYTQNQWLTGSSPSFQRPLKSLQ